MNEVKVDINEAGSGAFVIESENERFAEMVIRVSGSNLTVFHTHVSDTLKGKGISKKLLDAMVSYVRQHNLKVIPLCSFVRGQFEKHPDQYGDIWNNNWHK